MTELYYYDRGGKEPLPESALALLPPWRRERTEHLRRADARQESLAAGLLWRRAMALHGEAAETPVAVLPAGKPVLAGREDLWFSLSHSGRYLLCAVSHRPVGADVQEIRPVRYSLLRWFHPAEQAAIEALSPAEREAALFRVWTRKEAWVKAVSGGEMRSLSEVNVLAPLPGLVFRDHTPPGGYAAAVCAAELPGAPPREISREELLGTE